MAGTSVADRFAISPVTPCRSRLREPLDRATRRSGQSCHQFSHRLERLAGSPRPRPSCGRGVGCANAVDLRAATASPWPQPARRPAFGHGRVAARLRLPGLRFSASIVAGFWTLEARRVLNPHASIGIYGHEPGAGRCVVRMFMRFVAPRRRNRDCLKIVVSPVRFRASPLLLFTC